MRLVAILLTFGLPAILAAPPASAREAVDASAPVDLSVTVYRDPNRQIGAEMDRRWPRGFAMISETRDVVLPAGESTIRFEGVAEGMVAVSAIVTGLPGGTIEKNRNADLLSPAALVDGTLGNRVTVTRTNPGTGQKQAESAIVRSRADGGLVLQTSNGFEAVRCSGSPEGLAFDRIPAGLSAKPVFSINTRAETGGSYRVTLTYLAWGFDWQAHYVATLADPQRKGADAINLVSWLTILNDNDQTFADTQLMAVAGTLQITSDLQALADPPSGGPLRLVCYPIGSTATGSPVPDYGPYPPPPPPPAPMMMDEAIIVTGSRMQRKAVETAAPIAVVAAEEQLGDLKLYRVPERMAVAAKGLKQIAFLQRDKVAGHFLYTASCSPGDEGGGPLAAGMLLATRNDEKHGLGVALPMGGITIFEPSSAGDLLVGEENLRDFAVGQDVEISLGDSSQVFAVCDRKGAARSNDAKPGDIYGKMQAVITNANNHPVRIRLRAGWAVDWEIRKARGHKLKDGYHVLEASVPAGSTRKLTWEARPIAPK